MSTLKSKYEGWRHKLEGVCRVLNQVMEEVAQVQDMVRGERTKRHLQNMYLVLYRVREDLISLIASLE